MEQIQHGNILWDVEDFVLDGRDKFLASEIEDIKKMTGKRLPTYEEFKCLLEKAYWDFATHTIRSRYPSFTFYSDVAIKSFVYYNDGNDRPNNIKMRYLCTSNMYYRDIFCGNFGLEYYCNPEYIAIYEYSENICRLEHDTIHGGIINSLDCNIRMPDENVYYRIRLVSDVKENLAPNEAIDEHSEKLSDAIIQEVEEKVSPYKIFRNLFESLLKVVR